MGMVTVARAREYLDKVPAGAGNDAKIGNFIASAERIVVDALGFTFFDAGDDYPAASAKRLRAEQSKHFKLPPYEYGSITSLVTISGTQVSTTEITDYEETEDRFYLYRDLGWGGLRYVVTAKWGYGPAPESIIAVICELTVNEWRSKDKGGFSEQVGATEVSQQIGGGAVKFVAGLNNMQKQVIRSVRARYVDMIH